MKTLIALAVMASLVVAAQARPVLPGSLYRQTAEQDEEQALTQAKCALHPAPCRAEEQRERDRVLLSVFPNRKVFVADRAQALRHVVARPEAAAEYRKALVRLKPLWKEHAKR